ncbi:MAG: methyl-accepting chemotaxis protein [Lachnospiraceae bacterium]|nr:methyl-accepting chemotaxis protein [Lachnospiraceae bacterium]
MKGKVGTIYSIRTKLSALVAAAIVVTGIMMILIYSPNVKDKISELSQNYLKDLAIAYGLVIDNEIDIAGVDEALSSEQLTKYLAGVGLEGVESSYVYVVAPDGTMLYHPTPEKIGQPVENEVVKGVTADIQAGKKVENKVIGYEYKGANKYAAYFVNESQQFILVVTADEDEVFNSIDSINRKGSLGLLISFVICFGVAIALITILVINPIFEIGKLTDKVAQMDFSENDTQTKINQRKDEIGMMSRALSTLREQLINVVLAIRENSSALAASAEALYTGATETNNTMEQVESAVNDIANGASSQADETQEATGNVIVIGDMVKDTGKTVDELMVSAKQMQSANENAQRILAELREINRQSDEYIDVIAKQTEVTNESALKIGEATRLITDIASETNLLSLNASIEAARAGEQGRGFAVVASEIQKLAEQSTESAERIQQIIDMLLLDSEKAVKTMTQVKEIIGLQTEHIIRTDNAFTEIREGVSASLAGMQIISAKTKEMDQARVNVVDVVNNLTSIAEENAAATEETSASVVEVASIVNDIAEKAQGLNSIAEELEEKIGIFQI